MDEWCSCDAATAAGIESGRDKAGCDWRLYDDERALECRPKSSAVGAVLLSAFDSDRKNDGAAVLARVVATPCDERARLSLCGFRFQIGWNLKNDAQKVNNFSDADSPEGICHARLIQ